MAVRNRIGRCILRLFTDTVTIYQKKADGYSRTVVEGCQWSDKLEKTGANGAISIAAYAQITFPEGTYEGIDLNFTEEDGIVYGAVEDEIEDLKGKRLSDVLKKYPKSGLIKSLNDNSNRTYLKNVKVVVG